MKTEKIKLGKGELITNKSKNIDKIEESRFININKLSKKENNNQNIINNENFDGPDKIC